MSSKKKRRVCKQDTYKDLGEPYKVRIEMNETNSPLSGEWGGSGVEEGDSWHVEFLTLYNRTLKKEFNFFFNRWLGRESEDGELVREAPLLNESKIEVFPGVL